MSRLKTYLAVLFGSSLLLGVFAVSNAGAVTMHVCKEAAAGATATEFSNSSCSTPLIGGKFRTVPVVGTQAIQTTSTATWVMTASPLGINTEIVCKKSHSEGATATNVEEGGKMKIKGGSSTTVFEECQMNKPVGCIVPTTIKTKGLVGESVDTETTMRAKIAPSEGTAFTSFVVSNCGLLNGEKTVNGTVSGETQTTTTAKFSSTTGSALTYAGATATLTGETHGSTTDGTQLHVETP